MVDPNTRQGKRTPVTLKIKFKSETLEQFIERYAVDVSQGGIFIRTKEPLAVGTQMRFEFQLKDASPLIAGEGTVVWTRENDPSRPAIAPGMGVRFDKLADGSQGVLEKILAEKAKQAPSRPGSESPTKPPMFTDTPTVVAPANVQEALLGGGESPSGRKRSDSGKTPLPKPMPFHSDADEFPEEAFEEATKVRALDELIAQTADDDAGNKTVLGAIPEPDAEDLAQRARTGPVSARIEAPRAETATTVDEAPPERESAPVLPSPPSVEARPRAVEPPPEKKEEPSPALATPPEPKTRLGVEPAKAATAAPASKPAAEPPPKKLPAAPAQKSSGAPMIIGGLVAVAAIGAAVWFFALRDKAADSVKTTTPVAKTNDNGSAQDPTPPAPPPTPTNGSAGSAEAPTPTNAGSNNGSAETPTPTNAGSNAGSAETPTPTNAGSAEPPVPTPTPTPTPTPASTVVDTTVGSSVPGARVEILGTSFAGAAPLRVKLQRGQAYRARVTASGYVAQEIAFKGGDSRPTAKLEPKPRSISINSEPTGALIFIDGSNSGFTTPYTLELKGAQAKASIKITLRKNGFKAVDKVIGASAYKDEGEKATASINETLQVPAPTPPTPPTPPAGTGDGSASTGGGTEAPKEPTGGTAPTGGGEKQPEPDFAK